MNDMSGVIIPKSDQINADDLISGPRTITITEVDIRPGTEQPVSIYFEGDNGKPWRPCKSMSRVLVAAWGPDAKVYAGRSATLYRDPKVKWGGMEVGGIRVSHLSHIDRDMVMALTATKGKRAPYTVKPLANAPQRQQSSPNAAEKWASDHLGFVSGAADIARLDAVIAAGTKAMAKLETADPALHKQVADAYAARRAELTDDDDPFASQEGRADEQHGDQFPGDDSVNEDEAKADAFIERLAKAKSAAEVDAIAGELQAVQDDMAFDQVQRVDDAITAARKRFGK